jgi:PilZ domain
MHADLLSAEIQSAAYGRADRRKHPRVPVDVPARVKLLEPLETMGPSKPARVIEISRSGMKIRAKHDFMIGAVIQIIVKETFYLGTVRHTRQTDDGFDVGVRLNEAIRSSLL